MLKEETRNLITRSEKLNEGGLALKEETIQLHLGCGDALMEGCIGIDWIYDDNWNYPSDRFKCFDLNDSDWHKTFFKPSCASRIFVSLKLDRIKDLKLFLSQCNNLLIAGGNLIIRDSSTKTAQF